MTQGQDGLMKMVIWTKDHTLVRIETVHQDMLNPINFDPTPQWDSLTKNIFTI